MGRILIPLLLLPLLLGVLLVFDRPLPPADLVIASENEVFTLDPQRMSYLADMRLAYALYEGLLRWDIEDFTLEPAAASSWTTDDNGRRMTFHLRPEARWSNGAPVTAHDFVWSWQRLLLPDTAADYSNLFFAIDGADEFWHWREAQLSDFVADPWSHDNDEDARKALRGWWRRLDRLASADTLPSQVAFDPDIDLQQERQSLETTTDLPAMLPEAPRHRALWEALHERASRAAEARWMWDQTDERFQQTVGVTAPDSHTLIISLARPVPYFSDLLAFAPASPVYRPVVESWTLDVAEHDRVLQEGWHAVGVPPLRDRQGVTFSPTTGRLLPSHRWARPGSLVNNGPYQLDVWRYKRDMRLSRSPTYHDPTLVGFDTIEIRSIPDPNTAVLAFLKGEVDWLTGVGADCRIDLLAQRRRFDERVRAGGDVAGPDERQDIHAIPVFGTDFFSFNCRDQLSDGRANPFADSAVRRAFALATDKSAIVNGVTRLGEPIVATLVPPNSIPGYQTPEGLGFDPQAARASLAQAGWIDRDGDGRPESASGQPFPDVELLYTTGSPRFARVAVELRDQWQRHLGIPIVLLGQETKFFKDDLRKGNFMIARGRWYGDYGDPTTFLELCRSTDGNNDRGFDDPEVDAALDAAAAQTDPAKRLAMLSSLEARLFQEDLPLLPICQLVDVTMYDPDNITGVTHHPRLTHYLWNLRPTVAEVTP